MGNVPESTFWTKILGVRACGRSKSHCSASEWYFQIDMISTLSYDVLMAQLLVRNLDDELVRHLKKRAGEHGVSVEEEHRRILREALMTDAGERKTLWELLNEMPAACGKELFERERGLPGRGTEETLFES